MSERIATLQEQVFELFGACAGAPDDTSIGARADAALRELDELLAAAEMTEAANGLSAVTGRPPEALIERAAR